MRLSLVLLLSGVLSLLAGVAMVSVPAALVVYGVLAAALGLVRQQ